MQWSFPNESFLKMLGENQCHVQIGLVGSRRKWAEYSEKQQKVFWGWKNHILLDTCSTIHLFCNPFLLVNEEALVRPLGLYTNAGPCLIQSIAYWKQHRDTMVYFHSGAFTNCLSFTKLVRDGWRVELLLDSNGKLVFIFVSPCGHTRFKFVEYMRVYVLDDGSLPQPDVVESNVGHLEESPPQKARNETPNCT